MAATGSPRHAGTMHSAAATLLMLLALHHMHGATAQTAAAVTSPHSVSTASAASTRGPVSETVGPAPAQAGEDTPVYGPRASASPSPGPARSYRTARQATTSTTHPDDGEPSAEQTAAARFIWMLLLFLVFVTCARCCFRRHRRDHGPAAGELGTVVDVDGNVSTVYARHTRRGGTLIQVVPSRGAPASEAPVDTEVPPLYTDVVGESAVTAVTATNATTGGTGGGGTTSGGGGGSGVDVAVATSAAFAASGTVAPGTPVTTWTAPMGGHRSRRRVSPSASPPPTPAAPVAPDMAQADGPAPMYADKPPAYEQLGLDGGANAPPVDTPAYVQPWHGRSAVHLGSQGRGDGVVTVSV